MGHVVSGLFVVVVIGCTPTGKDPDTGGCYCDIRDNDKSISIEFNGTTVGAA